MDEYQSADAIQAQLEQLRQNQAAMERALEERREEEKRSLIAEVKQLILERGHQPADIAELLSSGQQKRRTRRTGNNDSSYMRYADPDNPDNVYSRGRMPNWLAEKMAANGYDPSDAEHRRQFKEQHLIKIAA